MALHRLSPGRRTVNGHLFRADRRPVVPSPRRQPSSFHDSRQRAGGAEQRRASPSRGFRAPGSRAASRAHACTGRSRAKAEESGMCWDPQVAAAPTGRWAGRQERHCRREMDKTLGPPLSENSRRAARRPSRCAGQHGLLLDARSRGGRWAPTARRAAADPLMRHGHAARRAGHSELSAPACGGQHGLRGGRRHVAIHAHRRRGRPYSPAGDGHAVPCGRRDRRTRRSAGPMDHAEARIPSPYPT